jgi:hypothetical protein
MNLSSLTKASMGMLMLMVFVIPQSFMAVKLPFLAAVLIWMMVEGTSNQWKIRSWAFLNYYLIFCLMSMVWGVIGLAKGNPEIAILEALRVYVVYMAIFCALAIYVSNLDYQKHVDGVVVTGALGIGLVAVYTLVDHIFQLGWLPQFIKDEMYLQVGLHDGYVQMNNVNIGMLTFIAPYLLSRLLLSERKDRHAYLILGLVVAVASALLASRRVVLVLLLIVPLLIFAINFLAGQATSRHRRRWTQAYLLLLLTAGVGTWMVSYWGFDFLDGFVSRVMGAFNSDPDAPRPLQHAALMAGFADNFLWGSGFGGITDVVRSDERPWTFELTYSRLLFNGGVIGFGLLMLFFLVYLLLVLRKIRQSAHAPIYISLLTGFLSVSIAAASNPYLSSFDFLFALSIIPLILNTRDQPRQRPMHEWAQP